MLPPRNSASTTPFLRPGEPASAGILTVLGSDSRSLEFIWITQIPSGRSSVSSLTGGFCEKSPAQ
jgi:hypothetical protein